jgi:hypothetical protein
MEVSRDERWRPVLNDDEDKDYTGKEGNFNKIPQAYEESLQGFHSFVISETAQGAHRSWFRRECFAAFQECI